MWRKKKENNFQKKNLLVHYKLAHDKKFTTQAKKIIIRAKHFVHNKKKIKWKK